MHHIPKGTTAEISLLTFQEALVAANRPCAEYDVERWLYVPNFYSEYRYASRLDIQLCRRYLAKLAQEQAPTNAVHGTEPYESLVQFGLSSKNHLISAVPTTANILDVFCVIKTFYSQFSSAFCNPHNL